MTAELWTHITIPGFEDMYQVSSYGRVKSLHRNQERILKPAMRDKYLSVQLNNKGKSKTENIHKLVALAFKEKLPGKTIINHIDGNKMNNNVENLAWVSITENNQHALDKKLRIVKEVSVTQMDMDDNVIKVFDSVKQAMMETGIRDARICCVCKGERKSTGGFKWKYTNDLRLKVEPPVDGKEILGFPRYLVTKCGKVYSKSAKRYMSLRKNAGYEYVTLRNNNITKDIAIHTLVATAFLDNPNNLPVVNHKDYDRSNNNLENLEWCTYSENMKHFGSKNSKPILKLDIKDKIIEEYSSIGEACKKNAIHSVLLNNLCKTGIVKNGFKYQYKDIIKTC